jgi:hypothetical protein
MRCRIKLPVAHFAQKGEAHAVDVVIPYVFPYGAGIQSLAQPVALTRFLSRV